MKKCVLFTDSFPYGFKEPFLETEIEYLSKYFDKVYIFSLSSNKEIRAFPSNVSVYSLCISTMSFKRIRKVFSGFKTYGLKIHKKNFIDIFQCVYFRGGVNIAFKRAAQLVKEHNIDLSGSIVYTYWSGFLACVGIQFCKSLGLNIPIVSRAHAVDLYDYRQKRGFSPFQEYIMDNVSYICPISNDGRIYLADKYPQHFNKIILKRLGTNDCGINHIISKTTFNVVSCSNIIPLKRLPLVLKSLIIANKKIEAIHWYCFGDGPELSNLKQEVSDSNFEQKVTFFGRTKNTDVLSFFKNNQVDLFINMSKHEGLPVSIMEAMSFGIPCLATNVGATSEIVDDNNGILVDSNINELETSKLIVDYYQSNDESKLSKRNNARKTWNDNYNSKNNYSDWCNFLTSLLARK